MIKQKRVNKRTKEFDGAVPEQLRVTEESREAATELSRKQNKVEELMRRMAIKLNKENQGN